MEKLVLKHGYYVTVKNEAHLRYVLAATQSDAAIFMRSDLEYPIYFVFDYDIYRSFSVLPSYCTNEIFVDPPLTVENETPLAGTKHDSKKPRYDLIPTHAEKQVVDVLTFGAEKYGAENWRDVDNYEARYIAAAMRHIAAHRSGEKIDNESGVNHLAHAVCSLMFILDKDAK